MWMGKDMMFSDLIMMVFCAYFFCNRWGDICYTYRQSAGLWWEDRYRPIVEAVVNLTLNIILVQIIGVVGVMLSTIIGLLFINSIWGSRVLFKNYFTDYKQSKYLLELFIFTVVTAVSCAVCYGICWFLPHVPSRSIVGFLLLGVRGGICVTVGNLIFWAAYRKLPQYPDAVQLGKSVIKRK